MEIELQSIGRFIADKRKEKGLLQSELGERLNVSPQSVSNWERGESLPDTALLPDLALILNCTVDELLGGGSCEWIYKKRTTVESIGRTIDCLETMKNILGTDHFMYRTMIDALDRKMNSSVESVFANAAYREAYVCEAIIECVKNGYYVDLQDIQKHVTSEKARTATLEILKTMGVR